MTGATFGGETRIPAQVRLLLMDCFETLVAHDGERHAARRGVVQFLDHFCAKAGVPMAVVSDATEAQVDTALREAGIRGSCLAIYGRGSGELLPDGRHRKSLHPALAAFQVAAEDAVYIGDSPLDAAAAQAAGVPFVRVPRSEDRAFSFATLISGPSRYRSSEFSSVFLDSFRRP